MTLEATGVGKVPCAALNGVDYLNAELFEDGDVGDDLLLLRGRWRVVAGEQLQVFLQSG